MVQIKLDKDDFNKIEDLLPDVCPNISFSLKVEDNNLVQLGFCKSAPCIVEFNIDIKEFDEMLEMLIDIEIDAFNTTSETYPHGSNLARQKYLKYGCLYNILYNAEISETE